MIPQMYSDRIVSVFVSGNNDEVPPGHLYVERVRPRL